MRVSQSMPDETLLLANKNDKKDPMPGCADSSICNLPHGLKMLPESLFC
jgi:hypothetical protein